MDLLKTTYDTIYDDEKHEFSYEDAMVVILFSASLNSLCDKLTKEIKEINIWLVLLKNLS